MLKIDNIQAVYGDSMLVLKGVSLEVPENGIVALLGANGAGKSTILKAVSGLLASEKGKIVSGNVSFQGERITGMSADDVVRRGIFHVIEGRKVFQDLSVEENLMAGGYTRRDRAAFKSDMEFVYDFFPRLAERRRQSAGFLSGGEQQMLAIGRGLMAHPRLLLLDEPSLGLAPLLVQEIFSLVRRINSERKTAILLVEQNASIALSIADYAYVLENGEIAMSGRSEELNAAGEVREFYLGLSEHGERRGYKVMKEEMRRRFAHSP
jgi:branched-chain amino acid transport system ATP-binding protein